MRKYIGITIGPIFDTICDASSPAALWFASNMFSDITRRLCQSILGEKNFSKVNIISPYYEESADLTDGVGKYHDRIVFTTEQFEHVVMKQIVERVKEETVCLFPREYDTEEYRQFFREYVQIHYVVKDEESIGNTNCILALSPYLDALELMKTFPKNDVGDPIRSLFLGEDNNGNKYIKNSPLYLRSQVANQLNSDDGSIRTIEEIAAFGQKSSKYKRKNYYVVVSADGDNMGKYLSGISNESVTGFSKKCLAYDKEASNLIGAYGGVTIYAGGDDLLFLAPITLGERNIFNLCQDIRMQFEKILGASELSVSFGISIQYVKYPLYEALEASRRMLKLAKDNGKNSMAIGLKKHSGQSLEIVVSNTKGQVLDDFLAFGNEMTDEAQTIHSICYTLDVFKSLLAILDAKVASQNCSIEEYMCAWDNLFDNEGQQNAKQYIHAICRMYYESILGQKDGGIIVPGSEHDDMQTLLYLLRLKYFLREKGGVN